MTNKDYNSLFVPVFKRSGAPLVKGKGMYLYDTSGKSYLDFGAGISVSALGHSHPALVETIKKEGAMLLHTSNLYFSRNQIDLARMLLKLSFGEKVFFCNSGTEANEAAIKFARKWAKKQSPEKFHILSFSDCFHGRTYAAMAATSQKKFHEGFEPLPGGFHYAPFNDIKATQAILDKYDYAAIFVEPLQGEGGINAASVEFLQFLRDYADKNKIALIYDEIQCGIGRTGTLWAYEQYGILPDMMTLAKPLGGGLPLGAVVCKAFIADAMAPGEHGTTFGGNSLACALGCALLKIVSQKNFLKTVRANGDYLLNKLERLRAGNPSVLEIRGKGFLVGARMKSDAAAIVDKCKDKGLLVIKANHDTVRFIPPLIATKKDIDKAINIFENVVKEL